MGPSGEPVIAVGSAAIDLTPVPVKDFAIQHFGSNDKTVLIAGILVVLAVLAMASGIAARRSRGLGQAGLAVLGALAVAAALTRPTAGPADAVPAVVGVLAGALVLLLLVRAAAPAAAPAGAPSPNGTFRRAAPAHPGGKPATARREPGGPPAEPPPVPGHRGRSAAGAAGAATGQVLLRRFSVAASRARTVLPAARVIGPAAPRGAQLAVPGITPFSTTDGSFYRVNTALSLPQVPPEQWRLRVHGMVERELDITFGDLLRRPLTEADITLACVSNPVGGPYVGNARWLGASLAALLREARVRRGADQILSTSSDGWTCGTPIETVTDGRNALLAVGMNGEPLPVAHGFPARMAGQVTVAGVAWAPHRGIDAVQVRDGSGPWHQARLAAVPGIDTWRQWAWSWDATRGCTSCRSGRSTAPARCSRPGECRPSPNGATGWDTIAVTVT